MKSFVGGPTDMSTSTVSTKKWIKSPQHQVFKKIVNMYNLI